MSTTLVTNLPWCLCFDARATRHFYAQGIDLVFDNSGITHVAPDFGGHADRTISGEHLFAMPGLIDIHAHPTTEPAYKGIREDHGSSLMFGTGLYERVAAFRLSIEGRKAAAEAAYAELLLSGVTTLVELSYEYPGWIETFARSGLRGYLAPGFASSKWVLPNAWTLGYSQIDDGGHGQLRAALAFIEQVEAHPSNRLKGMVYPAQIDTCSEDIFRAALAAARSRGLLVTTHVAQSVIEFQEIVRRHGKTPIAYAADLGLLEENCILGHAIFLDEHASIGWPEHRDLEMLSRSRAAIAHCPSPFARYGQVLQSLGKYLKHGITVGLGTDVAPHNMLDEMRLALILGRVVDRSLWAVETEQIVNSATVSSARALHRDDIGGLAVGMKADLVLVDLADASMRPVRDPIRSLLHSAGSRAVKHVFVDGRQVVENGRVLTLDPKGALDLLEREQRRMLQEAVQFDFAGRHGDAIAPLAFPIGAIG